MKNSKQFALCQGATVSENLLGRAHLTPFKNCPNSVSLDFRTAQKTNWEKVLAQPIPRQVTPKQGFPEIIANKEQRSVK